MILSSITPLAFKCKDSSGISGAGIFKCMRELHLFINKAYENITGEGGFGKAILLNQSLSESSKVIDNSLVRNNNSMILLLNLYDFDVEFIGPSKNYLNSYFTLNNAFSNSETIDYDAKRHFKNGTSLYKNLIKLDLTHEMYRDYMIGLEMRNIMIPRPKYYSINQEDKHGEYEGGLNEIFDEIIYQGQELIDRGRTTIFVHDLSEWDRYFAQLTSREDIIERNTELLYPNLFEHKKNTLDEKEVNLVNPMDITDSLFNYTAPSMIEGLVYAYDTSGKYRTNKNPDGNSSLYSIPNIPLTTPFAPYRMADNLNLSVKSTLDAFDMLGQSLEAEYGNIDMFYSPSRYGDRLKIVFNDYKKDNQPIIKTDNKSNINKVMKSKTIDNDIDEYFVKQKPFDDLKQIAYDSERGYIDFLE